MSTVIDHVASSRHRAPRGRVPTATPSFWVAAVLATAFAEAVLSWSARETETSVGVLAVGATLTLGLLLGLKLRASRVNALSYWTVFAVVGATGVLYSRVLTDVLAAPLPTAVMVLVLLLIAVLGAWRADEGTVSPASVTTSSRELSYWSAWLTTSALGATVGEWLLVLVQRGPAPIVAMGLALVVVVSTVRLIGAGAVLCLWVGAVAIWPLGAGVADWLASSPEHGGAGFGVGAASLLCMAGFMAAVAFSTKRSSRSGDEDATGEGAGSGSDGRLVNIVRPAL